MVPVVGSGGVSRWRLVGDGTQHLRPAVVAEALAHADDHEGPVGGPLDELAPGAAGQEAATLGFYDVHPPEVLVEVRRVGGGVHPGRLLDPARWARPPAAPPHP